MPVFSKGTLNLADMLGTQKHGCGIGVNPKHRGPMHVHPTYVLEPHA
jgi:hypothetical protein